MSAFVVDRRHIEFLVNASQVWAQRGFSGPDALELGQMLWNENVASVRARYPGEDELPGSIADGEAGYVYGCHGSSVRVDPVAVLKAIACYEYQSCEHDEWEASAAFRFCRTLTSQAHSKLPGWDDASWEVS